MVAVIIDDADLDELTEEQHEIALRYLSLSLSLRDREQVSKIMCKAQPDLITQTVKEGIAAYDPIIRGIHNAVDLSATCLDYENFLNDFVALLGKEKTSPEGSPATVEDFVVVLRKHQKSLHRFLSEMAKKGGDVTEQFRTYFKDAAGHFKATSDLKARREDPTSGAAGDLTPHLNAIVNKLPSGQRKEVLDTLDQFAAYLMALRSTSEDRMRAVLSEGDSPSVGPGTFLARWQDLIDTTPTTPIQAEGKIGLGSGRAPGRADEAEVKKAKQETDRWRWPEAPDVKNVIQLLQDGFKEILAVEGKAFWSNN
jgi:hypothetical protein